MAWSRWPSTSRTTSTADRPVVITSVDAHPGLMTDQTPSRSRMTPGTRTTVIVVAGLLVAFSLNAATHSAVGWPLGALAAVLAWLLTRRT